MASAISANKAELLAIANSVASEKMIDKAIVIEAMEEAIQKSARNRYGAENDIRAKLDPQTGDLRLWRVVEVVEDQRGVVIWAQSKESFPLLDIMTKACNSSGVQLRRRILPKVEHGRNQHLVLLTTKHEIYRTIT